MLQWVFTLYESALTYFGNVGIRFSFTNQFNFQTCKEREAFPRSDQGHVIQSIKWYFDIGTLLRSTCVKDSVLL